jgi:hypothetical protein
MVGPLKVKVPALPAAIVIPDDPSVSVLDPEIVNLLIAVALMKMPSIERSAPSAAD